MASTNIACWTMLVLFCLSFGFFSDSGLKFGKQSFKRHPKAREKSIEIRVFVETIILFDGLADYPFGLGVILDGFRIIG